MDPRLLLALFFALATTAYTSTIERSLDRREDSDDIWNHPVGVLSRRADEEDGVASRRDDEEGVVSRRGDEEGVVSRRGDEEGVVSRRDDEEGVVSRREDDEEIGSHPEGVLSRRDEEQYIVSRREDEDDIGSHPAGVLSRREEDEGEQEQRDVNYRVIDSPNNGWLISRRDVSDDLGVLLEQINDTAVALLSGQPDDVLQDHLARISAEAKRIIQESGATVNPDDAIRFVSDVVASADLVIDSNDDQAASAIVLITEIVDRVSSDPELLFLGLSAIEHVADSTVQIVSAQSQYFDNTFAKRQTTVNGHYGNGGWGVGATHTTSNGWQFGGNIGRNGGGTSYGLSISKTWRRRAAVQKRQTTVNTNFGDGPGGKTYGASVNHKGNGYEVNAHVNRNNQGTSYGGSFSRTWGGKRAIAANLKARPGYWQPIDRPIFNLPINKPIGGPFRPPIYSRSADVQDQEKRQTTVEGTYDNTPAGDRYGVDVSHKTDNGWEFRGSYSGGAGGSNVGASVSKSWSWKRSTAAAPKKRAVANFKAPTGYWYPGYPSGPIDRPFPFPIDGRPPYVASRSADEEEDEQVKRQTTVQGTYNNGPGGKSYGISASHKSNGLEVGGSFNRGPGGNSYGASVSKTTDNGWNIGGSVNHHSRGGTSVGIGVSKSWGRKRAALMQ